MKEPKPKIHEQWDGREQPDRWGLLEEAGESVTWCSCRYSKLPTRVKKALDPILGKEQAEVMKAWKRGEL